MLVVVHKKYYSNPRFLPFLDLLDQVMGIRQVGKLVFFPFDEVPLLLLVCCPRVDNLVLAQVVCCDDYCLVPVISAQKYPTPPAKAFLVPSCLFNVPDQVSEANCSCPPFLYPSSALGLVHIMGTDCCARQLTLEHLLQIVLIILVLEVEVVFAVH